MVTTQKLTTTYLLAILVATMPVLSMAAVVGGDYAQVAQQAQAAAGAKPGAAGGATSSNGTTYNSSVSSILHPASSGGGSGGGSHAYVHPEPMTNEITRDIVIVDSINNFSGYCACPYSKNNDGYECGVEAEYYKPGGYRIFCYKEDVRGQLELYYRKTH